MSFKYTAAALAASSLLVNAAPAPSKTEQQADQASKYWDPYNINAYSGYGYGSGYRSGYYGSGYYNGYNPFYSYDPNPTPQAEDYWGPNGFDGEAWNNAHRQNPYPNRKRATENTQNAQHGPRGSVFGDDDGDDTLIIVSPFSLLGGILPLPDIGALFGDLFGYGGQQAAPRPQQIYGYPAGALPYPKGALPPYAGGFPPFPKGAYPPMPKGMGNMPRPRPGAPGGPPIVAPLDNGAGSVAIGLNGGSFELNNGGSAGTPQPLNPGSPAGPFPKGWPQAGRPTPAPVSPPAGGITAPLDNAPGSQSLGLNPGTFSLDGVAGSAPLATPAPIPQVQAVPGPAGGIVSAGADGTAQSIGINNAGFSIAPVATPAPEVVPAPPSPAAVNVPAPAAPISPVAEGSAQLGLSGSSTTGLEAGAAPPAAASPMAMPMPQASPAVAASPMAMPNMPAASPAASPAAGTLENAAGGATANGALGLGASSATIS